MNDIDNLQTRINNLPFEAQGKALERLKRIAISAGEGKHTCYWIRDLIKLLNYLKEQGV